MSKLRVIIDGLVFENDYQIGIWRVFYEILRRLTAAVDITVWLRAPAVQQLPPGVQVVQDRGRMIARPYDIPGRIRNRLGRSWPAIRSLDLSRKDVFHSTYFTPCPVPGIPVVTTVHDMIAERMFYTSANHDQDGMLAKRSAILGATLCTAISRATQVDLTRFYPEVADRVRVIHHGGDHLRELSGSERPGVSRTSFALFVGQRVGYKNFHTVLDALTRPEWPQDVVLHVVGPPFAEQEWRLIDAMALRSRVVSRGCLSDSQLAAEYAGARCFVFPSLLEGFGLPILEAQTNRCPVACSDIAPFREVAGDAAVYFDPRLGESLAKAVATACEPDARPRLAEAGYENSCRFSWDRAAQQTLAVYEEAAALGCR